MKSLLPLFIICGSALGLISITSSQPKPSTSEVIPLHIYANKIKAPKVVVQFNSEWNKNNEFIWKPTPGVEYFKVDLDKNPYYKQTMKINSLPTIIIYENAKEVRRYEGGLHMKILTSQQIMLSIK
jgi:hypothetical protein